MKADLSVKIGKLHLNNPVMVASGTFGYAEEFRDFLDLRKLGAVVTKTITLNPRQGNLPARTCETPAGMLNSIGLENPGLDVFLRDKLPFLKKLGIPIIISIASEEGPGEFVALAKRLDKVRDIAAMELNISCPNIINSPQSTVHSPQDKTRNYRLSLPAGQAGSIDYRLIAQDPRATYEVVKRVRAVTRKTIITKLSPNVTDITEIARSAERAGSDAVSLINTLTGMSIDVEKRKPKIASITAGLSGPAIRPVAVRMVWEVYQKIKIPIIGMGGIIDAASALEFFLAGATAIGVGTANFINPAATTEIIAGIKQYLHKNKIGGMKEVIGALQV